MGHYWLQPKLIFLLLKMLIINITHIKLHHLSYIYSREHVKYSALINFITIIKIHKLYSLYANIRQLKTLINIKKYQKDINWTILKRF
jgi:isocitrate/isopropylmalate dehydrogenase